MDVYVILLIPYYYIILLFVWKMVAIKLNLKELCNSEWFTSSDPSSLSA